MLPGQQWLQQSLSYQQRNCVLLGLEFESADQTVLELAFVAAADDGEVLHLCGVEENYLNVTGAGGQEFQHPQKMKQVLDWQDCCE